MSVGPVKLELAGVVQSTWNFQVDKVVAVVPSPTTVSFSPVGGAVVPSTSPARMPPWLASVVKHCCVAAAPVSIAERFIAQISASTKEPAAVTRLYVCSD